MEKTGTPSTDATKEEQYYALKDAVEVIKFLLEKRENDYYEAQRLYRETQIRYDQAVIKLNWLREELEDSRSV